MPPFDLLKKTELARWLNHQIKPVVVCASSGINPYFWVQPAMMVRELLRGGWVFPGRYPSNQIKNLKE
jgi:hypothetical protein